MRILIAEDDLVLADGLLRTLRASGSAADHVASGTEAEAALMTSDQFDPGHETIEARLFLESEIPWDEIAFHTTRATLECFFADRRSGEFSIHHIDV